MSSEVKRIKRTTCSDLTDTSQLVSDFNQSWDRLPLEMAVHIYRFLPMNDKLNMSLTCKLWLAAFSHRGTWRYSHFVFTGNTSLNTDIPEEVLSSLQYLTVDCSVSSCDEAVKKTERLVNFVLGLNESKNTTLQMVNILDIKDLRIHLLSSQLHHHLSTLLSKQTKLCRLSLYNGELHPDHGMELLTAAGQNSAHCLKYLNLHNFSLQIFPPEPEYLFPELCGTFTNLTELSINCGIVSDDLLTHLSGTLKLIIVWVHWFDVFWYEMDPTYSDNAWNVLVSKCTGLKAKYYVEDSDGEMDISLSLVFLPAVPLATFYWCSGRDTPNIIRPCFDQIINTFKNRLEHVHVDVGCNFLSERDVVDVVERCPLLQTFSINQISVPLKRIPQLENIQV